jgi:hypothetical protein
VERLIAEKLVEQFLALDGPLKVAAELAEKIEDSTERKAVRRAIAEVVATVYTDLIRFVARQYPDLDPEDDEAGSIE